MGRGGSKPLWPPSITGNVVLESLRCFAATLACNKLEEVKFLSIFMRKLNGVLVDCVISITVALKQTLIFNLSVSCLHTQQASSRFKVIGSSLTSN
jgi:hypothetical protein